MPRKPLDLIPGPGEYNVTPREHNGELVHVKGGYIIKDER